MLCGQLAWHACEGIRTYGGLLNYTQNPLTFFTYRTTYGRDLCDKGYQRAGIVAVTAFICRGKARAALVAWGHLLGAAQTTVRTWCCVSYGRQGEGVWCDAGEPLRSSTWYAALA